ncbi:MAG: hypothetical protein ICV64_11420 [Thermoleophilia bacterium]|nr:hypothetical protein [Thermoleophilia bacterium]
MPYAVALGRYAVAAWAGALLAVTLAPFPGLAAAPLVAAAWVTAAAAWAWSERTGGGSNGRQR